MIEYVTCCEPTLETGLTKGVAYEVVERRRDMIKVVDDRKVEASYFADRFCDIPPPSPVFFVKPDQELLLKAMQEAAPGEIIAVPGPSFPPLITGYPDGNPKTAIGLTKPSMSNVPAPALLPMMKAFSDGAKKYGRLNWRENGVTASVYYDAAQRHLMAWWDGEDKADDSGVHHLGHAMACLAIILDAERHAKLNDDRSGCGEFSKMVKEMTETKH